jgi:hypothetical protein
MVRVPSEPWSRHWALLAGMVASHGCPGMFVPVPLPIGVAPSDWAPPAGAPPLGSPFEFWPELLPKALSSWAVTCWRSRGIESVTASTRSRAVALASAGRSHMPGVRSS